MRARVRVGSRDGARDRDKYPPVMPTAAAPHAQPYTSPRCTSRDPHQPKRKPAAKASPQPVVSLTALSCARDAPEIEPRDARDTPEIHPRYTRAEGAAEPSVASRLVWLEPPLLLRRGHRAVRSQRHDDEWRAARVQAPHRLRDLVPTQSPTTLPHSPTLSPSEISYLHAQLSSSSASPLPHWRAASPARAPCRASAGDGDAGDGGGLALVAEQHVCVREQLEEPPLPGACGQRDEPK